MEIGSLYISYFHPLLYSLPYPTFHYIFYYITMFTFALDFLQSIPCFILIFVLFLNLPSCPTTLPWPCPLLRRAGCILYIQRCIFGLCTAVQAATPCQGTPGIFMTQNYLPSSPSHPTSTFTIPPTPYPTHPTWQAYGKFDGHVIIPTVCTVYILHRVQCSIHTFIPFAT